MPTPLPSASFPPSATPTTASPVPVPTLAPTSPPVPEPTYAPTTNVSRAPTVVPLPAPTTSFAPTADPTFTRYPSHPPTVTPAPSEAPTPVPTPMPNTQAPTKWKRPPGPWWGLSAAATLNLFMGLVVFLSVVLHCAGSIFRVKTHLISPEYTPGIH